MRKLRGNEIGMTNQLLPVTALSPTTFRCRCGRPFTAMLSWDASLGIYEVEACNLPALAGEFKAVFVCACDARITDDEIIEAVADYCTSWDD